MAEDSVIRHVRTISAEQELTLLRGIEVWCAIHRAAGLSGRVVAFTDSHYPTDRERDCAADLSDARAVFETWKSHACAPHEYWPTAGHGTCLAVLMDGEAGCSDLATAVIWWACDLDFNYPRRFKLELVHLVESGGSPVDGEEDQHTCDWMQALSDESMGSPAEAVTAIRNVRRVAEAIGLSYSSGPYVYAKNERDDESIDTVGYISTMAALLPAPAIAEPGSNSDGSLFPSWSSDVGEIISSSVFGKTEGIFASCDMRLLEHLSLLSKHGTPEDAVSRLYRPDAAWLTRLARRFENLGRNVDLLLKQPIVTRPKPVSFLVPGWIPKGGLTLLAGPEQAGKSTLLHGLAVMVAQDTALRLPDASWLGVSGKSIGEGVVILLSGEEDQSQVEDRRARLEPNGPSDRLFPFVRDDKDLRGFLDSIDPIADIALLIVDPVLAFIKGNEDSSADVDAFYSPLVRFAGERNCAVIVVQHLKKGARPTMPLRGERGSVQAMIRGSGVLTQRPRAVLGITRRDSMTVEMGVLKYNMIQADHPQASDIVLAGNPDTLIFTPVSGAQIKEPPLRPDVPPVIERSGDVVNAVTRLISEGCQLTRTGRHELYAQRAPELAGLSRAAVRNIVNAAIKAGHLILQEGNVRLPKAA